MSYKKMLRQLDKKKTFWVTYENKKGNPQTKVIINGKEQKIFTPNVYNQWLALFRKDWEEKNEEKRKRQKMGRTVKNIKRPIQKELE